MNSSISSIVFQIAKAAPPDGMTSKIIAIDGCGGAGKSTLALKLSKCFDDCPVIHTDDFASWDNSTSWFPRMLEQALIPLSQNQIARFQKYDWNEKKLADWITIEPQEYIILEGVTAARKEFRPYLAFSIYVETDRELRLKRGLERDGTDAKAQWLRWMQEEDEYIFRDQTKDFVNVIVSGTDWKESNSLINLKFIITGCPGSGKTTLINHLCDIGFACVAEPARQVIAEQRSIQGDGLSDKNTMLFTELLLSKSLEFYKKHESSLTPILFDRGIPDVIGYAKLFGLNTERFETAAKTHLYNRSVFIAPPWKEIYTTDEERKMMFEHTTQFHEMLRSAYLSLGYELIELPFESVEMRAQFVASFLQSATKGI